MAWAYGGNSGCYHGIMFTMSVSPHSCSVAELCLILCYSCYPCHYWLCLYIFSLKNCNKKIEREKLYLLYSSAGAAPLSFTSHMKSMQFWWDGADFHGLKKVLWRQHNSFSLPAKIPLKNDPPHITLQRVKKSPKHIWSMSQLYPCPTGTWSCSLQHAICPKRYHAQWL